MRKNIAGALICALLGVAALNSVQQGLYAQQDQRATDLAGDAPQLQQTLTERGQYLVHHVAMCIYCHTPRSAEGAIDPQRLLQGAPMPVASPFPRQQWAFQAPKIAGLPGGWTDADMLKFLQTGASPTGRQSQPPMPPFRFNEHDAKAVAAYLKTLE
jgi:mono/diheme cytochrome c family protein